MSKNTAKNIVKLELEKKLKIEENLISKIMEYHGDLDKMLPEGRYPKKIKKCIRIDNWFLNTNYLDWIEAYHIIINVDMRNIMTVINNKIRVAYRLPTKYGSIYGDRKIEKIYDGLIKFKGVRYPYKLCNFTYLKIVHKYGTEIEDFRIDAIW